ncbi:chemotaxis protein CheW [Ramlibacter sp. RBP-2]|uniref:Chemotaxis protein CheW n=1 Tax=Ramlibacter lithotrophicus TaxID=2606681 RepID=A0A7X6I6G7_9BURK|nr:chemotaxis protein CheW [Ramlibacter lithotrophicus]NKE66368.1 chemotaxis protein CheW [Ramlibacter lithotrophicus]
MTESDLLATMDDAPPDAADGSAPFTAPARLLEYRRGGFVAFAPHTTMALLEEPPVTPVPGAPYYCVGLIPWQDGHVPLLDLNTLLQACPPSEPAPLGHALVLAWQAAPGAPLEYGAVCARSLVQMIEVSDGQACDLPSDSDLWPWIAIACFEHGGRAVPVVDTARLFAELRR